jgi:maltose alpha-D-glucosyltransferase/alpha-amylase
MGADQMPVSRDQSQRLFLRLSSIQFHFEAINVDVQLKNVSSLFWWMRVIGATPAAGLSHGTIEF